MRRRTFSALPFLPLDSPVSIKRFDVRQAFACLCTETGTPWGDKCRTGSDSDRIQHATCFATLHTLALQVESLIRSLSLPVLHLSPHKRKPLTQSQLLLALHCPPARGLTSYSYLTETSVKPCGGAVAPTKARSPSFRARRTRARSISPLPTANSVPAIDRTI